MKKLISALFLVFAASAIQAQDYQNDKVKAGQKAPELEFKDPEGKVLKLSEINKGRVVLLDFWASWCRPCRMANPKVVEIYKNYSTKKFKGAKKGFTVVSVSLDQNADAWKQAIQADGLNWPYHMSDLGSWQSKAADIYGIQFIPQSFLIGPDGKVIGWFMMVEQAEEAIKKLAE